MEKMEMLEASHSQATAAEQSFIGRKLRSSLVAGGMLLSGLTAAVTAYPEHAGASTPNQVCKTDTLSDGETVTGCITGDSTGLHYSIGGYNSSVWPQGVSQTIQFSDTNNNRYSAEFTCAASAGTFDYGLSVSQEYLGTYSINLGPNSDMVRFDLTAGGSGVQGPHPTSTCNNQPVPVNNHTCDKTLPAGTVVGMARTYDDQGYWIASSTGQVAACGDAPALGNGDPGTVGIAAAPDGKGILLATAAGRVKALGSAVFHGDLAGVQLNKPIVSMAINPANGGYWLLGSDGGVFSFDTQFYGSTGNIKLAEPAVGMASTNDGHGYFFVASDGGIFAYGDARFQGSLGGVKLNKPVVGMAIDRATGGYYMDASDGGIFAFNAPFRGSTGNITLAYPCVGMETTSINNSGYWFVAADGGIFSFHSPFEGAAA